MADQDQNIAETVRALATVADNVRQFEGSKPFVLVPDGYSVKAIEEMLPRPLRKTGKVTLLDSASFIAYFNLHKGEGSHIFGTVTPPAFHGQLNGHSADGTGWGDHTATYNCPVSREWSEWTTTSGKAMDQIAFAEFIESHLPDIHGEGGQPTGAELLEVATSFKATSKSNFASGVRLQNGNVDFTFTEETNATAGAAKGSIKVPETFFIAIPVFEGGSHYKVEAKLRYRLANGTLKLWYDLVRSHVVMEDAFKSDWEAIEAGTNTKIFRGTAGK